MSFFRATGTPVSDKFLVTSPLGFKARVGSALQLYSHCRGKGNVHSPRSTSGATHANLLAAGLLPVLSPHTVAEVRLPGFELVLSEKVCESDALPTELNQEGLDVASYLS